MLKAGHYHGYFFAWLLSTFALAIKSIDWKSQKISHIFYLKSIFAITDIFAIVGKADDNDLVDIDYVIDIIDDVELVQKCCKRSS